MFRGATCLTSLLAATLAFAGPAAAQAPARGLARVEGEVFDSLRMAPMRGATVWSETARRTTIADSLGRFVLDSVPPGVHLVSAADPTLDALGLQVIREVEVHADSARMTVQLATPGIRSMFAHLCREAGAPSPGTGILFGSVRSAYSGSEVAGAAVDVTWLRIPQERGALPFQMAAHLETDSIGSYAVCGVPRDTLLQVTARAGDQGESGTVAVRVGYLALARVDLIVAPPGVAGQGAVRGVVVDTTGRAISGVGIVLEGTSRETRSADDGSFLLRGLPIGTRTLIVRRPGFAPYYAPVGLMPSDTPFVRVELANVQRLAAVEVRAQRFSRRLEEIGQRRLLGEGTFFGPDELARYATYTSLFYNVPSIEVVRGRNPSQFGLRSRRETSIHGGRCMMSVWIDGHQADYEILTAYPVEELLAVEVYSQSAKLPMRYRRADGDCGAVLVWTKSAGA